MTWFLKHNANDIGVSFREDDDVLAEQKQVELGEMDESSILIKKLCKTYSDGKIAIDNLCLGIVPGECFGLLGINGKILSIIFHEGR